jgi:hypothetical protein
MDSGGYRARLQSERRWEEHFGGGDRDDGENSPAMVIQGGNCAREDRVDFERGEGDNI